MGDSVISQYEPDFAVHPGEHLKEMLKVNSMTQVELADRLGIHKKTINEIIRGKASLTSDTAQRLGRVFHYPAHLWSNLQRNYDEANARLKEQNRLESDLKWLKQVPVRKMIERKWIREHKDQLTLLNEVLRFFGIASPDQWKRVWETHQIAYRQSQHFKPCAQSVSVWLRRGEIEAQGITCKPFNRKAFLAVLEEARALTREVPEVFQPQLIDACAQAGVALVFVPELPRTGVSGCTRWLGDKAVIQLSLHYKSNDQLWFTFFHEAGHILKHGRREVFLESTGLNDKKEEEANIFASNKLIPPTAYNRFLKEWDTVSLDPIKDFSEEIGIAPGIVVGRLQFDNLLNRSHGNKLKVFYRWNTLKKQSNTS